MQSCNFRPRACKNLGQVRQQSPPKTFKMAAVKVPRRSTNSDKQSSLSFEKRFDQVLSFSSDPSRIATHAKTFIFDRDPPPFSRNEREESGPNGEELCVRRRATNDERVNFCRLPISFSPEPAPATATAIILIDARGLRKGRNKNRKLVARVALSPLLFYSSWSFRWRSTFVRQVPFEYRSEKREGKSTVVED